MGSERFDEIMKISPRRFHISASPPYGVGIVFCNHMNDDEESEFQLTSQRNGIRKCKPGIWRSVAKEFDHDGQAPHDGPFMECYVHWVADGTIDMTQAVKEWEKYDIENREKDAAIDIDKILPDGVEWVKAGSYYDDGGVCSILSTEYLTMDAAKKVMFAGDEDEEVEYGYYLETITLNHCDGLPENGNFTLGGMNFVQDAVGGPPYVAVARQNGQAIAIKLHYGTGAKDYAEDDDAGDDDGNGDEEE